MCAITYFWDECAHPLLFFLVSFPARGCERRFPRSRKRRIRDSRAGGAVALPGFTEAAEPCSDSVPGLERGIFLPQDGNGTRKSQSWPGYLGGSLLRASKEQARGGMRWDLEPFQPNPAWDSVG